MKNLFGMESGFNTMVVVVQRMIKKVEIQKMQRMIKKVVVQRMIKMGVVQKM